MTPSPPVSLERIAAKYKAGELRQTVL